MYCEEEVTGDIAGQSISIVGVNQIEVGGLHLFTENHPRSCSVLLQILKSPPAAFLMESWWWVLLLLGFGGGFRILDSDEDCFSTILDPPPPQITTSCLSPPPRWGEETSEKRERARMRKLEGAIYCHGPPHNINCLLWRIQQSIRYLEEGEIISLKLIRLLPLENYISSKPNQCWAAAAVERNLLEKTKQHFSSSSLRFLFCIL